MTRARSSPDAYDPKDAVRREAAAAKRSEDTERAILDALDALEQWIGDQLRMGLSAFVDDVTARCRRIAARLVDGKAAVLAGQIDELPGRLLALPPGDRPRGAVVELGKLVLLARAFRATPRDAEIRRAVAASETREAVLSNPETLRVNARWEVLAEQVQTRRDGLVSQTTWLLSSMRPAPALRCCSTFSRQAWAAAGRCLRRASDFKASSHSIRPPAAARLAGRARSRGRFGQSGMADTGDGARG